MPQGRSGVTPDSAGRLVFDAGEAYINLDLTALETTGITGAITGAIKLGATRDGSTFDPGRSLREIPIDGQLGPTKGFVRRENVRPTLTVNLVEISRANLARAIAGLIETAAGDYQKITGGEITAATYLDNVGLVTTYAGEDEPILLVITNALAHEAPTFNLQNRNELVLPVTFIGHIDPDEPYVEPWMIYHPDTTV